MAKDAPDGVKLIAATVIVESEPIVETPTTEAAIASYDSVSTSSSSYQTVVTWTISTDKVGILRAVEIACDNYAVAQFKLVVGGVTVFEDKGLPESFTKEWPDLRLAAAAVVTLSVKSDGSATIVAYGDLNAKEVG